MGENQEGGLSQKPGEEIVSQKKESSTSLAGGGGGCHLLQEAFLDSKCGVKDSTGPWPSLQCFTSLPD